MTQKKAQKFFKLKVLDPALLLSLPRSVTHVQPNSQAAFRNHYRWQLSEHLHANATRQTEFSATYWRNCCSLISVSQQKRQHRSACLPPSAAWQCAAPPAPAVSSAADTGSRTAAAPLRCPQLPRPPGRAEGSVARSRGRQNSAPSPLKTQRTDFSGATRRTGDSGPIHVLTLQYICCIFLHRDTNWSPENI